MASRQEIQDFTYYLVVVVYKFVNIIQIKLVHLVRVARECGGPVEPIQVRGNAVYLLPAKGHVSVAVSGEAAGCPLQANTGHS